ncbi:MAG: right-handed parallel beta-helix repeat-containing protein, partial [Bacteroidales bacterium]|nr:right-handed parallel beta-helix repeat-containing protein [Bacteroidales bacterium]
RIGASPGFSHRYFDGKIDEVRIWDNARDSTQIRENMYLTLTGTETGLAGYWQMNEGTGKKAYTYVGGNTGTLINMDTLTCWIGSSVPIGGGVSNTQMEIAGIVDFPGTHLSMCFNAQSGSSITVTRIDTIPNTNPLYADTVFDSQYWVVNRFGSGVFNADLTFTVNEDLTVNDENHPYLISIFHRNSNSHGIWERIKTADSVNAGDNSAVFKNITNFSQFIIGRKTDIDPPLITGLYPADQDTINPYENMVITFDDIVQQVLGKSIFLYSSDLTVVEEFVLPSSQVTGTDTKTITINPTTYLEPGEYFILADSCSFTDQSHNEFTGIINPETWNFTASVYGHISENTLWHDTVLVIGDVFVDNDITLSVEPGSYIEFQGHYKLDIDGTLSAIGTEPDTITFTAANQNIGWNRLVFDHTQASNDSSKIMYCRLEHGKATDAGHENQQGGALYIINFDKVIISHCTIENNHAETTYGCGGGINLYYSNAIISDNIITNNHTMNQGGGIFLDHSNATVVNNIITNNHSGTYGGGISDFYSDACISQNAITQNHASAKGGAIYFDHSASTVINNTFSNNSATNGGGISIEVSNPVISNNKISNNSVTYYGGGVHINEANPLLLNNTVCHNSAGNGGGGFSFSYSEAIVLNNTICNNYAGNGGGLHFFLNARPIIKNSIVYENTATSGGNQGYLYMMKVILISITAIYKTE